jgi:hypothetical protein
MQGVQDEHVKRRRNLLMLLMSEIVLKGNLKGKDKDKDKDKDEDGDGCKGRRGLASRAHLCDSYRNCKQHLREKHCASLE